MRYVINQRPSYLSTILRLAAIDIILLIICGLVGLWALTTIIKSTVTPQIYYYGAKTHVPVDAPTYV